MMARRFSYEGDHAEVTLYGVTFPQGEPVGVDPEQRPVLVKKLEGNSHFREHQAEDVDASPTQHTTRHRGRGKFDVLNADGEIVASGLTKAEAEAKASELNGVA